MRSAEVTEWRFYLGATNNAAAAEELHRIVTRLDEAYDIVNYGLKLLSGCPGGYVDESLVVSRTTLSEAIERLNETRRGMTSTDNEVA